MLRIALGRGEGPRSATTGFCDLGGVEVAPWWGG